MSPFVPRSAPRRAPAALLGVAVLAVCAASASADAPRMDKAQLRQLKDATVMLRVRLPDGRLISGSGFFAAEPGLVITNAHVLGMLEPSSRRPLRVDVVLRSGEADSRTLRGQVLGVDRGTDLGLLRVEGKELPTPVKTGSAKDLSETDDLFIFGFPFGEQLGKNITVSKSSVSSLRKSGVYLQQIQVNGGMHPGNSGGPVVDASGKLVGVAVSGIKGTAIHFAIPADRIHIFLNGRIHSNSRDQPYKDGDKVLLPVSVDLIDPLGRVRKVELEVWTGPPGVRQAGATESKSQPGDTLKQTTELSYDKKGRAAGEVAVPPTAEGKVLFLRPVVTNGVGEKRWVGVVGARLASPLMRVPMAFQFKPRAGTRFNLDLVNQATFKVRDDEGADHTLAAEFSAALAERVLQAQGGTAKVGLGFGSFRFKALLDRKPLRGADELLEAAKNVRALSAEMDLDEEGAVSGGRTNMGRVPRSSRATMLSISEQVMQSLESVSVSLPSGTLKPLQKWKAKRHVLIGPPGLSVPALADMEYTYLGMRAIGKTGKTSVAIIRLSGRVRGVRGTGVGVGGTVSGSAMVLPQIGLTLSSDLSINADLDVQLGRETARAAGTLFVKVRRLPPSAAPLKKDK